MIPKIIFRAATPNDLDSLVDFDIAAKPFDPSYEYVFPYRHDFPEDCREYTGIRYAYYLAPENTNWFIFVAETQSANNRNKREIVGSAVWDVSYINKRNKDSVHQSLQSLAEVMKDSGASTRRDADHKRLAAVGKANQEAYDCFEAKYGTEQVHLRSLHIRQEYWRHGIGSKLVSWGMYNAREGNVPVTVISTEMGQSLYSHLGFKKLGPWVAQVEGETEHCTCEMMVHEISAAS